MPPATACRGQGGTGREGSEAATREARFSLQAGVRAPACRGQRKTQNAQRTTQGCRPMKLQNMTWQEVAALSRECVVVIPTGSLEQHGPHLPLFTDSLIVTAVAEA